MRRIVLAAISFLLAIAPGCGPSPNGTGAGGAASGPPRSVVLVTVEAIRPDLLSTYGGDVPMPGLDRLAARGVVFEDAATVCPMARPSLATIMTGLAPDRSGVRDDVTDRLPADATTVASLFKATGHETAAFVTTPFASYSAGFDRGFGLFDGPDDDAVGPARYLPRASRGESAAGNFAKWISGLGKEKTLFAWVHLADMQWATGRRGAEGPDKVYRAWLPATDKAIGQIEDAIEKAGRSGGTEILVVGTHGTHLGEDGALGGSFWLDAATLRVPLVWAGPGAESLRSKGQRDERKVWLPDVAATLGALANGRLGGRAEGIDLRGEARAAPARTRFAWTWAPDDQLAWPPLTAVEERAAGWRAFDSTALSDPSPSQDGAKAAAAARPAMPRNLRLSPEMRQEVLDAGVVLGREAPMTAPAPERRNGIIEKILALRQLAAGPGPRKAAAEFEEIEKSLPDNFAALTHRIQVAVSFEQKDTAATVASRLLASYPERPESLHWAAHAWWLAKDYAKVQALLDATVSLGRVEPEVYYDLACVRALQKDPNGAMEHLREAVDAGYRNWSWIERDPDLSSVRPDPKWAEFLKAHGR
ncbi:MAG: sulfatase-like hydrolase/transferase [Acidobacteriia bacterium]|nr:sulfatase-like hydrolase/transferase [Terriglobia bacterium]